MKKLALTLAIVLGMSFGAFAQEGGLFGYGFVGEQNNWDNQNWNRTTGILGITLPQVHNYEYDQPAAPLGSGALLLIGFGAAYALKKKNQK